MSYYIERYYPYTIAALFALLFHLFREQFQNVDSLISNLANSSLLVSATLLGFLLTVTTIINGIDNRRMRIVKQQDGFPLLLKYLKSAIHYNILAVSVTIALPFAQAFHRFLDSIAIFNSFHVFIIVLAWASSIRFSVLFIRIIGGN